MKIQNAILAIAQQTVLLLKEKYNHEIEVNQLQIDPTRKEFEGDYTLVIFPLLKAMAMKPEDAGKTIGNYISEKLNFIDSHNTIKGFLNLRFTDDFWYDALQSMYIDSDHINAKTSENLTLVEFSSPNTNKPLHLGHLRNNFLGHAVSLIKAFEGDKVVKTQIINDRGVHICKSMLAWQRFGNGETPKSSGLKGDKLVGKYYVLYDKNLQKEVAELCALGMSEEQAKKEATLAKDVQEMLVKWEQGDQETIALWRMMNDWVYEGFEKTYNRMGITFDKLYFESDTYKKGKEIVLEGLEKSIFEQHDNGSVWVDLSNEGLDNKLLIRADGTTVYMTQDIGTAAQRHEDYPNLKQVIYTVGDEQDYHFKVLFMVLSKLGYSWASACKHLSYGMVDLPSGKMKSREGTVVDADDLMEDVVQAAKAASKEKGKLDSLTSAEQSELFEMLGIGALKFYLLRVDPKKRMMFNPEESVALNGDTGPFIQYTHARCKAVLRNAGTFSPTLKIQLDSKERELIQVLTKFREVTSRSANDLDPSQIASYCLDLAKIYNQFYHDLPILKAEAGLRELRLTLTALTASTIRTGMALLGISVPNRM